jgi:hypothetical protein
MDNLYPFLQDVHYWLSRAGFFLALVMAGRAILIGLIRHGDVTREFRRGAYVIVGLTVTEALIGATMYFVIGARPGDDIHLIYGAAAVLTLPFFIYVEKTAQKRPAMGSYIWGFLMLAGVLIRSIMTGPMG